MIRKKYVQLVAGALALAGLTACGGGGGAAGKVPAASSPPVAVAPSGSAPARPGAMRLSSPDGPVTAEETASFRSFVQGLTPAGDNLGNNWAQGHSGEEVKAMGMVYEVTHDRPVLDRMISFCDAVLAERNDLAPAPVGHHVLWTGKVDPAWPNDVTAKPIGTGGEQGDPIGHLASCARLILQTPELASTKLPDPHGYGATYRERAERYVAEADTAVDRHVLARLLTVHEDNRMYFAADNPYQSGHPVPWNQQMMFDYAFQNLAQAHELLHDAPQKVKRYDQLVQASVNWFFGTVRTYTDPAGRPAYDWSYAPLADYKEDNSHGSLDCAGLYRAYLTGRYGITPAMLAPLADTFADVMSKDGRSGHYAGKVDGTDGSANSAPTDYVRSGWLLTAEARPDVYHAWVAADLPGGVTTAVDRFARVLELKSRRAK